MRLLVVDFGHRLSFASASGSGVGGMSRAVDHSGGAFLVNADKIVLPLFSRQVPHLLALQTVPRAGSHVDISSLAVVEPVEEVAAVSVLEVDHLQEVLQPHHLRILLPLRRGFLAAFAFLGYLFIGITGRRQGHVRQGFRVAVSVIVACAASNHGSLFPVLPRRGTLVHLAVFFPRQHAGRLASLRRHGFPRARFGRLAKPRLLDRSHPPRRGCEFQALALSPRAVPAIAALDDLGSPPGTEGLDAFPPGLAAQARLLARGAGHGVWLWERQDGFTSYFAGPLPRLYFAPVLHLGDFVELFGGWRDQGVQVGLARTVRDSRRAKLVIQNIIIIVL
ncbi:hypothetical protein HYQ46_008241 [Verticillium longisporum]|nr:hypothetical protein HYQ46_008241 [Verticillium longisporum]